MEGGLLKHNRHSIRLKQYDYRKPGYYFITICTQDRKCLFGSIENEKMVLTDAGAMIVQTLNEIPSFYDGVAIDEFQIMPNHFHGIVVLESVGVTPRGYPVQEGQPHPERCKPLHLSVVAPTKNRLSLSDVVHRFKSLTTTRYSQGVKNGQWEPFNRQFWQRNYYEHVIRDENELSQIREYTSNNPKQWVLDRENIVSYMKTELVKKIKEKQPWQV